eukprot:767821-Hanusia_phi.AAC.3
MLPLAYLVSVEHTMTVAEADNSYADSSSCLSHSDTWLASATGKITLLPWIENIIVSSRKPIPRSIELICKNDTHWLELQLYDTILLRLPTDFTVHIPLAMLPLADSPAMPKRFCIRIPSMHKFLSRLPFSVPPSLRLFPPSTS